MYTLFDIAPIGQLVKTFLALLFSLNFTGAMAQDRTKPPRLILNEVPGSKDFKPSFCIEPPLDQICPTLPNDQTDFSASFEYFVVSRGAQEPFDFFSWQSFVALNWPLNGPGNPAQNITTTAVASFPLWQTYRTRQQILGIDTARQACGSGSKETVVVTGDLVQTDGSVLIDQAGNFIVYETRANTAFEGYVLDNALQTYSGQQTFGDTPISFPQGRTGTDATPASILVKTAWRILTGDRQQEYIAVDGLIHVPAERAQSGQAMCLPVRLGLVGMHIVTRVNSGNGNEWIWSTFEHRKNAPIAANARSINSIYDNDLFPDGCKPPAQPADNYTLFDANCPECQTNADPGLYWKWANNAPFARIASAPVKRGSQIVRCWDIFHETRNANKVWGEKLTGSVLANYMLISTQWRGANKSALFEQGEVPRFLSNLTMETYIQTDLGTCLGCHANAQTAAGQNANFSFFLRDVPD